MDWQTENVQLITSQYIYNIQSCQIESVHLIWLRCIYHCVD